MSLAVCIGQWKGRLVCEKPPFIFKSSCWQDPVKVSNVVEEDGLNRRMLVCVIFFCNFLIVYDTHTFDVVRELPGLRCT